MGVVIGRLAAQRFLQLSGTSLSWGAGKAYKILQPTAVLDALLDLFVGRCLELEAAPYHVGQTALERGRAVALRGDAIGQDFLEARGAMADTPEDKVIDAQEVEGGIEISWPGRPGAWPGRISTCRSGPAARYRPRRCHGAKSARTRAPARTGSRSA